MPDMLNTKNMFNKYKLIMKAVDAVMWKLWDIKKTHNNYTMRQYDKR